MQAKKSLGQNFLINESIIEKIAGLIDYTENDLIIEIGPGRGALSRKLAEFNCQYVAIEIDKDMEEYLNPLKINVIYEDILKVDMDELLSNYKYNRLFIIGNLPYYITSPILDKLSRIKSDIYKMIFMVQKEVGLRYSALPGNKDYGYMSVYLQHKFIVKKEFDVVKGNFMPVPKVDSCIITLINNNEKQDIDFEQYNKLLKDSFQMKRKTLKNNLRNYDWNIIKSVLIKNGLNEDTRAENISREIFLEIFKELKK